MHEEFRGHSRGFRQMREAFVGFVALATRFQQGGGKLRDIIEFMIRHESWLLDLPPADAFEHFDEVLHWYAAVLKRNETELTLALFDGPPLDYSCPMESALPPKHWRS